jgi:hypothetical protein
MGAITSAMEIDMLPGNSWNAANDIPDQDAAFSKRSKIRLFQLLPIKPAL